MASQHRSCRRACPAGPVLFRWGSGGLLGGIIGVFNGLADPSAVGEFVAVLLHPRRNLCRLWVPAGRGTGLGGPGLLGCARRPAMIWGRRVSRSSCVLAVDRSISCRRPPTLNCTVSSAGPSSMVVLQEDLRALGLHNTLFSVSLLMGCETSHPENLRPHNSAVQSVSHPCALSMPLESDTQR